MLLLNAKCELFRNDIQPSAEGMKFTVVVPAEAGTHCDIMDSRLRGNDRIFGITTGILRFAQNDGVQRFNAGMQRCSEGVQWFFRCLIAVTGPSRKRRYGTAGS